MSCEDAYKSLIRDMRKALGNAVTNLQLIKEGARPASLFSLAQTENDLKAIDKRICELMDEGAKEVRDD